MGTISECFRSYPDVVRSRHPEVSFAAWGSEAERIVADHRFDNGLGEGSPLARAYERDGAVLLLGVSHDRNTSLHLAEHRANIPLPTTTSTASVFRDDECVEIEYENTETSSEDFAALGTDFEREVGLTAGQVGAATAKLINQRDLVDFAVEWFETNR